MIDRRTLVSLYMMNPNSYVPDFKINILTEPILNRASGDTIITEISLVTKTDLKLLTKSRGWLFNWKYEFNQINREVYKLTILDQPIVIQGLMSLTVKSDHVYIYLLESTSSNIGRDKIYEGVPGNLVAFACKLSFQSGGEGYVSFESKTELIDHYINTLGASNFGGRLMIINSMTAKRLIDKYIKD